VEVSRYDGKNQRTYKDNNIIIHETRDLWIPPGGRKEDVIPPSQTLYPFEFNLPDSALPTLEPPLAFSAPSKSALPGFKYTIPGYFTGTITYVLQAKIDRPRALDPKGECPFRAVPTPVDNVVVHPISKVWAGRSNTVQVNVSLEKDVFMLGEKVTGKVTLIKRIGLKLRAVEVAIKFVLSYTAYGNTDSFNQYIENVRYLISPDEESQVWQFTLTIPSIAPFTEIGKLVRIEWGIEVKLDIPWRRKPHIVLPFSVLPLTKPAVSTASLEKL